MNRKQKTIFLIMVSIDTIMGLFPPWHQPFNITSRAMKNLGYDFIFTPPGEGATIVLLTLLTQVAIVTFVCLSLIYFFKTPKIVFNEKDSQPQPQEGTP